MKISLAWLRDFVDVALTTPELENLFRRAGLEVAGVTQRGANFPNVIAAEILDSQPHPNADRLSVCKVNDGTATTRQIVCGAKNYRVGDKVPLALPGAILPGDFRIQAGKLRGVESDGMLCSAKELLLAEDSQGLLILPRDTVAGTPIGEIFLEDTIFELETTPNRPDWLSHYGIAREIGVFTDLRIKPLQTSPPPMCADGNTVITKPADCPFYSLRRIRGVKIMPSPHWLQERLLAVGLRPINNIVDVTNYVLMETGQPLHAFDASKLTGALVVRSAREGETFSALDGKPYLLEPDFLVIADEQGAVALAGVMGGAGTGVTNDTQDIFLESAIFEPRLVRKASHLLSLMSDSSYRFERGVDPEMVTIASSRATDLILQIAGGTADEELLTVGELPTRTEVALRPDRVRSLLGVDLSDSQVASALQKIGLQSPSLERGWTVPGYRGDLTREVDLIEEVARMIGMDRIPSRSTASFAASSEADVAYDFVMRARGFLASVGYHEARTGTLVSEAEGTVTLKNPFGADQSRLRSSLLPGLLHVLSRNLDLGTNEVRIFEAGRIFTNEGEFPRLSLLASAQAHAKDWRTAEVRAFDLFDLKGLLQRLLKLTEENFQSLASAPKPFAVALQVVKDGHTLGIAGLLHPDVLRTLGIPGPVVAAELDTAAWQSTQAQRASIHPLPKFPSTSRDLALIVPHPLAYADVRAVIHAAKVPFLVSVDLFDLFTDPSGERLAADQKSLGIALTFRSPERTLLTAEINGAVDDLRLHLREKLPVEFRD